MTPARGRAVAIAALAAVAAAPGTASASISPAQVLAGPDATITELGGVAMSGDGTGGLVFRRVDATGSHIYAARYANGAWTVPQRIDTSLPYDSVQPRIAAGDGGRLVAVWAQDYAHKGRIPLYRLQSATVAPGERAFETPVTVASTVSGDGGVAGAQAVDPDLAMNDAGVAYVAFRSLRSLGVNGLRPGNPGDTSSQFRVARYAAGTWSGASTVNRSSTTSVPRATPDNGPEVSVDVQGNGLVAFLEPDDAGVARVWARRLFNTRLGLVQPVSATTVGGQPLRGDVDAFALDGGGLGSGAVVYRQQPGLASPLPGVRQFVGRITAPPDPGAPRFGPAVPVTDDGAGLSVPAIASDDRDDVAVAYATGDVVRGGTLANPLDGQLAYLASGATAAPQIAVGPGGTEATAWPTLLGGLVGVGVHQRLIDGTLLDARLSGTLGGPVSDLHMAGSGLGDALVAFVQGAGPDTQVVVATVRVPPQPFTVAAPKDWIKPRLVRLTWKRPASSTGPVRYSVLLDGETVVHGITVPISRLPAGSLEDGEHQVVVRATDATGEVTDSRAVSVFIDAHPPLVRSARIDRARRLTLRLGDDAQGEGAGVDRDATTVRFGDGTRASGPRALRHTFKRPGRYRVVVHLEDLAGNTRTAVVRVTA